MERLCPLTLCALSSAGYAASHYPFEIGAALSQHRLIYDGHAHWDALLDQAGLARLPQSLRFNQTGLALDAAASGQGVALAPAVLAKADVEAGRLVELWRANDTGNQGYYIVTPNTSASAPVQAMADWLRSLT